MLLLLLLTGLLFSTTAQATDLTHGPMVGHTSGTSTRIWVRADSPANLHVELTAADGTSEHTSEHLQLTETGNYCGSVSITGLAPSIRYTYTVFLDGHEQPASVPQQFTTFPLAGKPGVIRFGFGHGINGTDAQPIWKAIADKDPMFFLIMGDNIYSNSTEPKKQRRMYLEMRAKPGFRTFGAQVPIYAVYDDHDYGANNSDRTQPGKARSLSTFFEIWANPNVQTVEHPGIWTRFTAGQCEFWLLDGRYHRSPNDDPDGPNKTMLGREQREWFNNTLATSNALFKFPVSGSSWHCGGKEAWNHQFLWEYDTILSQIREDRVTGIILLGGDQHDCKVSIRPRETWGGYDLHEWMAGRLVNPDKEYNERPESRGFGMVTVDTRAEPPVATVEFFDNDGKPRNGSKILYTQPGALRALWDSPAAAFGTPPRSFDGELRHHTSEDVWDAMPVTPGYTIPLTELQWPEHGWEDRRW
jgi:alkaline phosphatase D